MASSLNTIGFKKLKESDFEFHNVIGEGGFAKVFLANKKDDPEQIYAIKVINKVHFTDKSVEQVLRELKILSLVSDKACPFLTQMYCSF